MRLHRLFPIALLLTAWGVALGAASPAHAEPKPPPTATCVKWWGEVRPRAYGYDHVVHLESSCKKTAVCAVSSDVNPEVQMVSLPAGASTEVLTFMGSPAYEFTPRVTCKLP